MAMPRDWVRIPMPDMVWGLPDGWTTTYDDKLQIWFNAVKTPDEFSALSELLTNPLVALPPEALRSHDLGSWKVVTSINNHHRRLNARIVILVLIIDAEEGTAYVVIHKRNEDD